MNAISNSGTRKLLVIAIAVLAPATSALAAQDCSADPFAGYRSMFGPTGYKCMQAVPRQAGVQGPAGPILVIGKEACRSDPHSAYHHALRGDGPDYVCVAGAAQEAGVRGPAGPTMAGEQPQANDAHSVYHQVFTAD